MTTDQPASDASVVPENAQPVATSSAEIAHDHPDGMTVLLARDTGDGVPSMVKQWSQGIAGIECRQYDKAWLFQVHCVSVATFVLLCAALATIKPLTRACVVRGRLLSVEKWRSAVRRLIDRDGKKAMFGECARRWVLLDFDTFACADFPDPRVDPQGCIEAVRLRLPAGLCNVACFWSFSSSTGIKPGKLGVHLYLLLETPLGWRDVEAFIVACGADRAMSRAVQVHYTGVPVFVLPLTDPLPKRFGTLPGIERVPANVIDELIAAGRLRLNAEKVEREDQLRATRAAAKEARKAASPPSNVESRPKAAVNDNVKPRPRAEKPSGETVEAPAEPVPGMIGDGFRNQHLMSIAGFSRSHGLDGDGLHLVLSTENNLHCHPPLAVERVETMANSYSRYPVKWPAPDAWAGAVIIAAGLIRHGACIEAVTVATVKVLGNETKAAHMVDLLLDLPDWQLVCAEHRPELYVEQEGAS